jgi:hypothetical protein
MAAATDRFFPKINGTNIKLEKGVDLGEDFKLLHNIEFTYRNYKFVIETGKQGAVTTVTGNPEISFDATATRVIGPVPIRATAAAAGVVAGKPTSLLLGAEPYPFHKNNSRPLNFSSSGVGGASSSSSSGGGGGGGGGGGFLKRVEAAEAAAASSSKAASSPKASSPAATRSASTSSGGGSSSSGGRGGAASPATSPKASGGASSPKASSGASSPKASAGGLQKGGIQKESFLAEAGSPSTLRKRKTRKNINRRI